jgi:hypothetical protein
LGLFEIHFTCLCLFHKILQAIQDEVRQAFHLPLDQIVRNLTNKLMWFLSSYCHVGVCAILEKVIQVSKRSLLALGSFSERLIIFFRKSLFAVLMLPIFTTIWTIFQPLIFADV